MPWLALAALVLLSACAGLRPRSSGPAADQARAQQKHILSAMHSYLGTRYRSGGASRAGMDCSGFTLSVYRSAGISLPRTAAAQFESGRKVARVDLQPGDLLFFNTQPLATSPCACALSWLPGTPHLPWVYSVSHTGIYAGGGRFVHASPTAGVSWARLEDEYWNARYLGARRFIKDLDESEAP